MIEYGIVWDDANRSFDNHTAFTSGVTEPSYTAGASTGSMPSLFSFSASASTVSPGAGTTTSYASSFETTNSTGTTTQNDASSGRTYTGATTTDTSGHTAPTTYSDSGATHVSGSLGPLDVTFANAVTATTTSAARNDTTSTTSSTTTAYTYGTSTDTDSLETFTTTRTEITTQLTTYISSSTATTVYTTSSVSSTRDLRKNNYDDTAVIFLSDQFSAVEVVWRPTNATTGGLTQVAAPTTNDFTLRLSDYFVSSSTAITTQAAAFSTTSTSTSVASGSITYLSADEPDAYGTGNVSTARHKIIGTAAIPTTTALRATNWQTATFSNSALTGSETGLNFSTYTTTRSLAVTTETTIQGTFLYDAITDDAYAFFDQGLRSTTGVTSTTGKQTYTTWTRYEYPLSSISNNSTHTATGSGYIRRWSIARPIIGSVEQPNDRTNTYFLPAPGAGWFAGVNVAGQQSALARGFDVSMPSHLLNYQFSLDPLLIGANFSSSYDTPLIQKDNVSAIYRDPVGHGVGYVRDGTLYGQGGIQFITSSTDVGMTVVVLSFRPSEMTTTTTTRTTSTSTDASTLNTSLQSGSITLSFTGNAAASAHSRHVTERTLLAYGGVQSQHGASATVLSPAGRRSATSRDAAGGSTTATTQRSATITAEVSTGMLVFESTGSVFRASTGAEAGVFESYYIKTTKYQTGGGFETSKRLPNPF